MTSDDVVTHASQLLDLPNFEDGEKIEDFSPRIKVAMVFQWEKYTNRLSEQSSVQLETVESPVDATFFVRGEISVRLDSFSRYWMNG